MPVYDYHCEANGQTVEVTHPVDVELRIWGEVCYVAQVPLGETDPAAPVHRVVTRAPAAVVRTFDSEYRNLGFTKLVRRDEGVYENVTAIDGEKRYMRADDPDSVPHIHRKVRD
jgi:hypothetical protein